MKTTIKLLLLVILVVPVARGQNPLVAGVAPTFEVGGGYSYVNTSVPSESRLGMNGAFLTGNADFTRWFGIAADLGYVRNPDAFSARHSADILTYMAGPVFYPVRKRNMNVYTRVLLGGARETGVNFEHDGDLLLGYTNKFAWAVGGGVEYRLSRSFAARGGADFLHTSFFSPSITVQGQTGIRATVGLIYNFGEGHEK
ncbi:MAG: outer membrane beta-barrel protein [Candidatus Acidiferrum sp.]